MLQNKILVINIHFDVCLNVSRESNINVISRFNICVNNEIREWQFSPIFRDFEWKISIFLSDLHEISKVTWIGNIMSKLWNVFNTPTIIRMQLFQISLTTMWPSKIKKIFLFFLPWMSVFFSERYLIGVDRSLSKMSS